MNILELKRYISKLEEEGYNATSYIVNMYGKITFPLINFLMVLIAVPFAIKEGRRKFHCRRSSNERSHRV